MTTLAVSAAALKATVWGTTFLSIKMLHSASYLGLAKIRAGSRPPEDRIIAPKAGEQNFFGKAADDEKTKKKLLNEKRWNRIVGNDLECIPIGLAVAFCSLWAGNPDVHVGLMALFCASRLGHTYCYAKEIMPMRSYMWFGGVLASLGMAANASVGVLYI